MIKTTDLREKEVINVTDGTRLGMISDIEVDLEQGYVKAIIIPGPGKILGVFGKTKDIVIKWKDIVRIGSDVILVNLHEEHSYQNNTDKE